MLQINSSERKNSFRTLEIFIFTYTLIYIFTSFPSRRENTRHDILGLHLQVRHVALSRKTNEMLKEDA